MNITGRLHKEKVSTEIISLDQTFFPTPWTTQQWIELNPETHSLYSWRIQDNLVGFSLLWTFEGEGAAHLLKILLLEESRGSGSSHLFWSAIENCLRARGFSSVYLEVEAKNLRAQGFYSKMGFQLLRRVKGYYSSGDDALMMSLTL
jgi:ribosomal-protein-alanine N-acetyltransferase